MESDISDNEHDEILIEYAKHAEYSKIEELLATHSFSRFEIKQAIYEALDVKQYGSVYLLLRKSILDQLDLDLMFEDALKGSNIEFIEILLNVGQFTSSDIHKAILMAIINNDYRLVRLLLSSDMLDSDNVKILLTFAVTRMNTLLIDIMLKYYKLDETTLTNSILESNDSAVQLLLIKSSESDNAPYSIFRLLVLALQNQHYQLIDTILTSDLIYDMDSNNVTILHLALFNNYNELASIIIQNTPVEFLNRSTIRGYTAVHIAVQQGQLVLLNRLIQAGADLDKVSQTGLTALHMAIIDDNSHIIQQLIDANADIYKSYLAVTGSVLANELFSRGQADCSLPNLHLAVAVNSLEAIRILLNAGFDINTRNDCAETVLHIAYKFGRVYLASKLIELGADSTLRDNHMRFPRDLDVRRFQIKAPYCSVARSNFRYTCYTKHELLEIAEAWNQQHPSRKINTRQSLTGLVDQMREQLGSKEWCWVEITGTNLAVNQIFRPNGGRVQLRGTIAGLLQSDIIQVFEQYEKVYPDLKILIVVDKRQIRVDSMRYGDEQRMEFDQIPMSQPLYYSNGKYYLLDRAYIETVFRDYGKIAIYIGVDRHAHSLFINKGKREIDYFDSAGSGKPVNKIVQDTINMLVSIAREYADTWDINYNKTMRQDYGKDCAIYSIYYLTNRIRGVSFAEITSRTLRPEDIYRYRNYYFRPDCR